jgi:TetR/AcrR family transcriptional regulator
MAASPAPLAALASSDSPPVRRRLSSQDRRSQLIAQAIKLFSQRGFSGTRTKDIAAACGVSEGILFRHFATKEDLYHAILESHADEAGSKEWMREMKRCAAARNDQELIRSLVTHILRSFEENAAFHRLMLYAWLEGHSLAALAHQQLGMPTFEFLRRYVTQRQREGAFRAGDAGAMVVGLYAPALQHGLNKHVFGMDVGPTDPETVLEEFVRLAFASLRAPVRNSSRKK